MKKILSVLTIVALFAGLAIAEVGDQSKTDNRGMSGFVFLRMPVSARTIALSDSVYSNDLSAASIFGNVSELSEINNTSLFYSQQMLYDNLVTLSAFSVGVKVSERIAIGGYLRALTTDPIEITTIAAPEGTGVTYEVSDMELGVAFSARVTKRFSIGIKTKMVTEKISQTTASTVLFDVATLYRISFSNIKISTVFENYGPDARYDGNDLYWNGDTTNDPEDIPSITDPTRSANLTTKEFSAPTSITVAVSADLIGKNTMIPVEGNTVTLHTALLKSNDAYESGAFGLEYVFSQLQGFEIALRGGTQMYRAEDWDTTFSFGGGLKYQPSDSFGVIVDYAYKNNDNLDASHFFSIGVNF